VRRKKYDTPVFRARHPALNEYISAAVKAVGEELAQVRPPPLPSALPKAGDVTVVKGTVDKIVVVIQDKDRVALERFVFAVQSMIEVEAFDKDSRFVLPHAL
jgi:mitotic spindle assembly checkpoint protein MAD2B